MSVSVVAIENRYSVTPIGLALSDMSGRCRGKVEVKEYQDTTWYRVSSTSAWRRMSEIAMDGENIYPLHYLAAFPDRPKFNWGEMLGYYTIELVVYSRRWWVSFIGDVGCDMKSYITSTETRLKTKNLMDKIKVSWRHFENFCAIALPTHRGNNSSRDCPDMWKGLVYLLDEGLIADTKQANNLRLSIPDMAKEAPSC